MKIEQMHRSHHAYYTVVTVGEKQFSLQTLRDGTVRLREGTYSRNKSSVTGRGCGGRFEVTDTKDFTNEREALNWCEDNSSE